MATTAVVAEALIELGDLQGQLTSLLSRVERVFRTLGAAQPTPPSGAAPSSRGRKRSPATLLVPSVVETTAVGSSDRGADSLQVPDETHARAVRHSLLLEMPVEVHDQVLGDQVFGEPAEATELKTEEQGVPEVVFASPVESPAAPQKRSWFKPRTKKRPRTTTIQVEPAPEDEPVNVTVEVTSEDTPAPAAPDPELLSKSQNRRKAKKPSALQSKFNEMGSLATINASKAEISAERRRCFTGFHPRSLAIARWDFGTSVFYFVIIWFIPISTGFSANDYLIPSVSIGTSAFYVLDTIRKLVTRRSIPASQVVKVGGKSATVSPEDGDRPGRSHKTEVILTLGQSQLHYLARGFVLDVVTMVPWELFAPFEERWLLMYLKLIRVRYLFNIVSTNPYYKRMRRIAEEVLGVGQTFSGIFILTGALMMFLHLQACGIFLLARLTNYSGTPMGDVSESSVYVQYTYGLFYAVANTFPLAYKPTDPVEQWVIAGFVIVGACIYFSFGLDASGRLYKQKLDELNEYMKYKNLPETTRKRVRHYYAVKYRGKFFEEATLLDTLNESLRHEVATENCKELIVRVPFLNRTRGDGRDVVFLGRVAAALVAQYFIKDDRICNERESGDAMYFIVQGRVLVHVNGALVTTLRDGQYFGEIAMVTQIPRTATIIAGSSCILYKLKRDDFLPILQDFDDVREVIDQMYRERVQRAAEALPVAEPEPQVPVMEEVVLVEETAERKGRGRSRGTSVSRGRK